MLKIVFGRPRGAPEVRGPYDALVFNGRHLTGHTGERIATHGDHSWLLGDTVYSRLDIAGPVEVTMSSEGAPGRTFGPYTDFSCVDGVAYTEGHVFAFIDEQLGDWYCIADGRHWRALGLRPA